LKLLIQLNSGYVQPDNVTKPTPNFELEFDMFLKEPASTDIIIGCDQFKKKWNQNKFIRNLYQLHLNTVLTGY
jgi:hypothetical protein